MARSKTVPETTTTPPLIEEEDDKPAFSPEVLEIVARHLKEWVVSEASLPVGHVQEIRLLANHFEALLEGAA